MSDQSVAFQTRGPARSFSARILLVDDDATACELLAGILRAAGHVVAWETRGEAVLRRIEEHDFDVVIADISMDGMDGIQLCTEIQRVRSGQRVILVTGYADLEVAIEGLRAGACDFLVKPISVELLLPALSRAFGDGPSDRVANSLARARAANQPFEGFIGCSGAMGVVFDLISRVAESEASVVITGESGTGKELVARSIHEHSRRRNGDFVSLNCAAVPSTLIESELFGHVRGSFTDASADRVGLFVRATGGTLFLDEIGELPLAVQPKLLRALQERVVRPVGGTKDVPFDTRIITATNRDLEDRVAKGTFRGDLLYRIDVVRIPLPPLRERGGDILLLAQHFMLKYAARAPCRADTPLRFDRAAAEKLLAYDWPGNVRELENAVERAIALARGETLTLVDLPRKIIDCRPTRIATLPDEVPSVVVTLDELRGKHIVHVLELVDNNKTHAARLLGVDRRSLYRRLVHVSAAAAARTRA